MTEPESGSRRVFTVKFVPLPRVDAIRSLRGLLKLALRRFGLKCIEVSETTANAKREEVSHE